MFGINIFDASLFPAMLVALAAGGAHASPPPPGRRRDRPLNPPAASLPAPGAPPASPQRPRPARAATAARSPSPLPPRPTSRPSSWSPCCAPLCWVLAQGLRTKQLTLW